MSRINRRRRYTAVIALMALGMASVAACSSDDVGTDSSSADSSSRGTEPGTAEAPVTTDSAVEPDEPVATAAGATDPLDEPDETSAITQVAVDPLGEPDAATGTPIRLGVVTDGSGVPGEPSPGLQTVTATVEYPNAYLGGINGHVIEIEDCSTDATPSGATQCAVEMLQAGVAAVLVPVSVQDGAILAGLGDSGIPYFTYTSADPSILTQPGSFVLTNAISQIAVPGLVAQEQSADKVGFIIIDFPAATGPITAIAQPIYANLGVELQIIPISPQVPDMAPAIQQAIGGGADVFAITGTDPFTISAINGLDQLGFEGTIVSTTLSQAIIDGVAGGAEGVVGTGAQTDDPSDADVQLYEAVLATYAPDVPRDIGTPGAFATVIGFVRALTGVTDAVDASSVSAALGAMPQPIELPFGGGITFQCGSAPLAYAPGICSIDVLRWTYGAAGERLDVGILEVPPEVLALG